MIEIQDLLDSDWSSQEHLRINKTRGQDSSKGHQRYAFGVIPISYLFHHDVCEVFKGALGNSERNEQATEKYTVKNESSQTRSQHALFSSMFSG